MVDLAEAKKTLNKFEKEKTRKEERLENLLKQKKDIEKQLKKIGIDNIDDIPKMEKELEEELASLFKDIKEVEDDFGGDDLLHDLGEDDKKRVKNSVDKATDRKERVKDSIDPEDATDELFDELGLD